MERKICANSVRKCEVRQPVVLYAVDEAPGSFVRLCMIHRGRGRGPTFLSNRQCRQKKRGEH